MRLVAAYLGVILIWSTTPLAIQWSSENIGFVLALTIRMLISLLLSYAWMRLHRERLIFTLTAVKVYLASVLGVFGAMMATYWSAQYIASGLISVLFGLAPVAAGLFAWLLLKENFFRLSKLAGTGLALLGLLVIFHKQLAVGSDGWKGVLGMLLGVSLYGASSVIIKRLAVSYSVIVINTGSLLMAMPFFALACLFSGQILPEVPEMMAMAWRDALAIAYLGIFGSFLGFILYYYVLKNLSLGSVMLIPLITPVIALILGAALNNEALDVFVAIGAFLVLGGLLLYQWDNLSALWRDRRS